MTGQFAGRHGRTDNVPGVHPYALMQEPLAPLPDGTPAEGFVGEAAAGARLPDPVQPGGYSLVQALKAAGYRTALCGKWHLPLQHLTPKLAPTGTCSASTKLSPTNAIREPPATRSTE